MSLIVLSMLIHRVGVKLAYDISYLFRIARAASLVVMSVGGVPPLRIERNTKVEKE
ncbi:MULTISPECIES: hypothetical protein [unclassified Burkholderia]|uniref:hypothetical protein n=1 Tax=unclassified Burkholderia TaxID=2613784 RepID=UPI002AB24BDA|nr:MULTISPECIES: hypothetical protein [unclassified Burkholderia]